MAEEESQVEAQKGEHTHICGWVGRWGAESIEPEGPVESLGPCDDGD